MCFDVIKKKKKDLEKDAMAATWTKYNHEISVVAEISSAVFFFPEVSIATAASHSLKAASLTREPVTNENCNEAPWQEAGLNLCHISQLFFLTLTEATAARLAEGITALQWRVGGGGALKKGGSEEGVLREKTTLVIKLLADC